MAILGKKKSYWVNFIIIAKPGSRVYVAGTFNNWDPKANPLIEGAGKGNFITEILVPFGEHEYKFIVNDRWQIDPSCNNQVLNPFGSQNSVVSTKMHKTKAKISSMEFFYGLPKISTVRINDWLRSLCISDQKELVS